MNTGICSVFHRESEGECWGNQSKKVRLNPCCPNDFQAQRPLQVHNFVQNFLNAIPKYIPLEWIKPALEGFEPICLCGHLIKRMFGVCSENFDPAAGFLQPPAKIYNDPFEKKYEFPRIPFENDSSNFERQDISTEKIEKLEDLVKSEPLATKATSLQSKWKNCYGLIMGRVIKSCKEYFRLVKQVTKSHDIVWNSRVSYIYRTLSSVRDQESFEKYLKTYQIRESESKRRRGKTAMLEFLREGGKNGIILARLIQDFLTEENLDRQSYIKDLRKPKSQIVDILRNPVDLSQLREKFCEMEQTVQNDIDNCFR